VRQDCRRLAGLGLLLLVSALGWETSLVAVGRMLAGEPRATTDWAQVTSQHTQLAAGLGL